MNAPNWPELFKVAECQACGARVFRVRMKGGSSLRTLNPESRRMATIETTDNASIVGVMREAYEPHDFTCTKAIARPSRKGGRR